MIKLKKLLKESYVWDRKFGEKLPTLVDVIKLYEKNAPVEVEDALNELAEYHEVEYYEKYGEHGSLGHYPTFKTAVSKATSLYKREKKEGTLGEEDTQYIGVSGTSDTFAVIYVDKSYFKRISAQDFQNLEDYKTWMKVAKKTLSSGKPNIGKFTGE